MEVTAATFTRRDPVVFAHGGLAGAKYMYDERNATNRTGPTVGYYYSYQYSMYEKGLRVPTSTYCRLRCGMAFAWFASATSMCPSL